MGHHTSVFVSRILGVLALTVLSGPAMADLYNNPATDGVGMTRIDGYFGGPGGEFTLTPTDGLVGLVVTGTASDIHSYDFQAFCVEVNENVIIPGQYFSDINTYSTGGGAGGQDGNLGPDGSPSDSLGIRTAWLYREYRYGTLTAGGTPYRLTPGTNRNDDAKALQQALWYLEGEITLINSRAWEFVGAADAAVAAGWNSIGNVRILNMWSNEDRSVARQDQLALVVPAPGAAFLGLIGLGFVGAVRRLFA